MNTNDLNLLTLLITRPTLSVEEAVRLLAARQQLARKGIPTLARAIRPPSPGVVTQVMRQHATAPKYWSN